jgi:hypothetical protein
MRNGQSRDDIGQMMGHSNSVVTEHYLASIDTERTFKINQSLMELGGLIEIKDPLFQTLSKSTCRCFLCYARKVEKTLN